MRFLVLLLAVLLVSCATPKTAPKSFYAGVYAPGHVEILESNEFKSRAVVLDADDIAIARKSAFARLLLEAKAQGYRSFRIVSEKQTKGIGHGYIVRGDLLKSYETGSGYYSIDAIKRLLKDLPLEEPKPVVKPKPRKTVAKAAPKPIWRPGSLEPAPQAATPSADDEPLVIMAPEDITGSVRAANGGTSDSGPALNPMPTGSAAQHEIRQNSIRATSGVPTGVVLRRN